MSAPVEVQEDVVRPLRRRRDAVDRDAIERQHDVVEDAQPAAALRRPPARRRTRRSGARDRRWSACSDTRACACRSSSPHDAGKVEDRVQVAQLGVRDLEERPRARSACAPGGGGGAAALGASAAMNPIPVAVLQLRRTATAPRGTRRSWMEKLPPISVRSFTFASRCGTSSTTVPSGSVIRRPSTVIGRRLVGHDVDQRAQPPGHAADLQLARVRRAARLRSAAQPRPLQHDGRGRGRPARPSPRGRRPVRGLPGAQPAARERPLCHKVPGRVPMAEVTDAIDRSPPNRQAQPLHRRRLNFLFRAFHALPPLKTTKGLQTGAIYGLCQMMLRIEREQRPTHLCVVYDAPGRQFPQRRSIPSTRRTARRCRPSWRPAGAGPAGDRRLRAAQLEVPGFEADDIIATLTKVATRRGHGGRDLLVRQGSDAALLTTKRRRARHHEEPALRGRPRCGRSSASGPNRSATCWR